MHAYNFGAKGSSPTKLPRDVSLGGRVNSGTTFGGTALLKFGKAKNVQNLARRSATFDFDCKYLCSKLRCPQAVNCVIKNKMNKKTLMNFGPLTMTVTAHIFTHLKSTLCILCMLTYLVRAI